MKEIIPLGIEYQGQKYCMDLYAITIPKVKTAIADSTDFSFMKIDDATYRLAYKNECIQYPKAIEFDRPVIVLGLPHEVNEDQWRVFMPRIMGGLNGTLPGYPDYYYSVLISKSHLPLRTATSSGISLLLVKEIMLDTVLLVTTRSDETLKKRYTNTDN